jgi:hypothetical protein
MSSLTASVCGSFQTIFARTSGFVPILLTVINLQSNSANISSTIADFDKEMYVGNLLNKEGCHVEESFALHMSVVVTLELTRGNMNHSRSHKRLHHRIYLMAVAVLSAILLLSVGVASATPTRGSVQWSIILCTFTGSPAPTRTANFFRDMFVNRGTGGLADYLRDVSNGAVDFNGSVVRGWYTEPFTMAQAQARSRSDKFQDCLNAARNSATSPYTPPAGHLIAVITDPDIDLFGMGGVGAFLPQSVDLGGMTHEVMHGMGLDHSFSDDPNYRNADWAQIGEYDDQWDVMSWANVFGTGTARFGSGGPGLNGYHMDEMGWLGRNRIHTFGANGQTAATFTLAALNSPATTGHLLVRIPFDPADPYRYYTVEFRRNTGWDAGIGNSIVLIHEIRKNANGRYYTYLLRERTAARNPIQRLNANGVTITINSINAANNQAIVTITGNIAERCVMGFVWREASPTDRVCVIVASRTQARQDNALAASRRNPNGGLYGPDTCLQGFVWREAFPSDHVCVTVQTRTQTRQENERAAERRNPARFVYGPNTCRVGFVWREADLRDYVCVTPAVRAQTWTDNALAATRRSPNGGRYGPDTCLAGYVWREAFPGDHVCVIPPTRTQARQDNANAGSRWVNP